MNYHQKAWTLFGDTCDFITSSVRILGRKTGISKSSVQRHKEAYKVRQQYPESIFWESEEGKKWLFRLVLAAVYEFGLKSGVGSPTLERFFDQIHINTHLGLKTTSIDQIRKEMIKKINLFGEEQVKQDALAKTDFISTSV